MHPSKLLSQLGIAPLKKFGQNFLINNHSLKGAENLFAPESTLLEIGPGLGMVTQYFSDAGFKMVLIEKDRTLAAEIKRNYPQHQVICDDFLKVADSTLEQLGITAVVSNLPFYITTPILERVCAKLTFITTALWGMQKEVAERITAAQGNSLTMFLRATGDTSIFSHVSRNSFFPVPQVDVSWVVWRRNTRISNLPAFELLLRGLFWGRRKSIISSLKKNPFFENNQTGMAMRNEALQLEKESNPISELFSKRPDILTFDEFQALFKVLLP